MTVPAPIGVPYLPTAADLRPFAADLWLVAGIVANLAVPFVARRPNLACGWATLVTIALAGGSLIVGWPVASGGGDHLRGMLVADPLAAAWQAVLLPFVAGVTVLWMGHGRHAAGEADGPPFLVLLLGATLGLSLLGSTENLLMAFVALAMASLPSYALAGVRTGSRRAAEAALKYVLFGAVVGGVFAYGLSFVYGLTGSLQLAALRHTPASAALAVGLVGVIAGGAFKASAVPLHTWVPDVFEGAPVEVTAFLSVASKGAGIVLLLRVVRAVAPALPAVPIVVAAIGALTATVGNVAALPQRNVKRLLAYSSVAQAGYMLCALAVPATAAGPVVAYLAVYAVMNLGAFAVVSAVVARTGSEDVAAFGGLGRAAPVLAGSMLACLVSLIGLPPVGGFWAKLGVLVAVSHARTGGLVLIAVIVANTVVSAFYYLRVAGAMYLRTATGPAGPRRPAAVGTWVGGACAAALAAAFVAAGPLLAWSQPPVGAAGATATDSAASVRRIARGGPPPASGTLHPWP